VTGIRALLTAILASATLAWVLGVPGGAMAQDRNFAASAQLDYHFVPAEPSAPVAPAPATTFEGFTLEAATKIAADISDHLSANVKVCYGCHGFELDMAYFDLRAFDELNLRVGRFSPTFGAFNLRHDPANHMTSDKPLPYDMGRMLRKGDWHEGVLPSPFPMNGAEINGTHWAGSSAQLDYAAYIATGFKNDVDPNPTDLDFQESHLPYYVTSNPRPAAGARLALTFKIGGSADTTIGASALGGTYDPHDRLSYAIVGADWSVRIGRTALRMEYLVRRQQMDTSNPDIFKYAVAPSNGDFVAKHGGYVEIEVPITDKLDALGRADALYRVGNVANPAAGSGNELATYSPLSSESYVVRETFALAYALERNFRFKGSVEGWEFSYADPTGRSALLSFHLGAVGSF
jgi:hypothetical protein